MIYLFVDGLAERLHLGHPREAVLAAWGVLTDGNKVCCTWHRGPRRTRHGCRESFQDCAGAACLIGLLRVGSKGPEEGRFEGYFTP